MSLDNFAGTIFGAALLLLAFVVAYSYITQRTRSRSSVKSGEENEPRHQLHAYAFGQPTQFMDQQFGEFRFNGIDAYDCRIELPTPHSTSTIFAIHAWAWASVLTERQHSTFASLITHYDELWPQIADTLARLHPSLKSREEVLQYLKTRVAVHVGEYSEDSLELVYEFDLPEEGFRGFFLRVEHLEIVDGFIAE